MNIPTGKLIMLLVGLVPLMLAICCFLAGGWLVASGQAVWGVLFALLGFWACMFAKGWYSKAWKDNDW